MASCQPRQDSDKGTCINLSEMVIGGQPRDQVVVEVDLHVLRAEGLPRSSPSKQVGEARRLGFFVQMRAEIPDNGSRHHVGAKLSTRCVIDKNHVPAWNEHLAEKFVVN